MSDRPFVSIIIPCRNEEKFIGICLDSVLANNYPRDRLEVCVVDGTSEDATRAIVERYIQRYSVVQLLENRKKITAAALNVGIVSAKGEIIIWMSAHNRYEKDYVSRSVECLKEYSADNVGGIIIAVPREDTLVGRGIVAGLSHSFGVGKSFFRIHAKQPKWVDTVFGGCYRREVFEKVGLFNEELVRGQDIEFNLRLRKSGGRTLLVPEIRSCYYARSDLKSFWKHNWSNGVWAILPFLYSDIMPVSWRHLVPLGFILGLLGSAVLSVVMEVGLWLVFGIAAAYGAANVAASVDVAIKQRDVRYIIVMPVVFASLHVGYGLGSWWGLIKVLKHVVSGRSRKGIR